MQMALFDKIYTGTEVEDMSGLDRTYFINDIYNDYKMCKDLRQEKMEAFVRIRVECFRERFR